VHVARVARERGEQAICWRIAMRLQGCVPTQVVPVEDLTALFDQAVEAARADGNRLGEIDVQLAKATYLVAVERYREAFAILAAADHDATDLDRLGDAGTAAGARTRRATVHRKLAEAHLQMAAYGDASAELAEASRLAERADSAEEQRLIRLLTAENHRVPSPDPSYADILEGRVDDPVYFRARLGLSEAARRRGYWKSAEDHLRIVERHSSGDARRTAAVYYRLARLYVDRWRHTVPNFGLPGADATADGVADLPATAVRLAAEAALAFHRTGNPVGLVRAQCQQVRALVIADRLVEAEQLCHTVWHALVGPALAANPARCPLLARFARARGELLLHRGDIRAAWRTLAKAATLYAANDDWACHAEIWRLLDTVQQTYPYPAEAALAGVDAVLEDAIATAAPARRAAAPAAPADRTHPPVPHPRHTHDDTALPPPA